MSTFTNTPSSIYGRVELVHRNIYDISDLVNLQPRDHQKKFPFSLCVSIIALVLLFPASRSVFYFQPRAECTVWTLFQATLYSISQSFFPPLFQRRLQPSTKF
jgi:hypothetical protein